LLPRGRPRPRGVVGEPRFRRAPSASAMEDCLWKRNPRWRKDNVAEEDFT
jgi:hypothetical protein